ncbi:hypothetical protein U8527_17535 [Kordia algicida OT-1]|uniref:Uncharacterized protein n=1 Tax=Kordia algicida OT-1 TaxID=391587 RepID=A9E3C9_9FLAO|nr:hypothetical protein [Kordia algicida]EDP95494.1 hypothetical protein KAOT1_11241 [Kordia algicida OT-1]
MKKERKLKLEVNKVSVSNLNNTLGGGSDLVSSVNFPCVITTVRHTIPGLNCKTFLTASDSAERC